MAKMGSGTGLRKIALSQIVDSGNVRENYRDIEELAESIKRNGQLEPVLVKALDKKDADGIDKFELVAGHRRRRAIQHLCDSGEGFTVIDAIVITGDKLTLQLVENLQRSDLTAAERESGIFQMCKNGVSQKEVAARLSKSAEYVSRNISAFKVREAADTAGVDTSTLATATLNEIQAAAADDYPVLVKEIIQDGGTLDAARAVMENYRVAHGKPANPQKAKAGLPPAPTVPAMEKESTGGISDPLALHPSPAIDPLMEHFGGEGKDIDTAVPKLPPPVKPAKKETGKAESLRAWIDDFDPPHKKVDFNDVCLLIMGYAKKSQSIIKACKASTCDVCNNRCAYYYKDEACKDLIALLHTEL